MKRVEDWKIETIKELRKYRFKARLLAFFEVLYHTILPILFTFWLLTSRNPLFFLPLIIIVFARLKVKRRWSR